MVSSCVLKTRIIATDEQTCCRSETKAVDLRDRFGNTGSAFSEFGKIWGSSGDFERAWKSLREFARV